MLKQQISWCSPTGECSFGGEGCIFASTFKEPHGRVTFRKEATHSTFVMEGDCTPYKLFEALAEYRAAGLPPATALLFDLSQYAGTVDWDFVRTIPELPVWHPIPDKVAFLVGCMQTAQIVKVIEAYVPVPELSVFGCRCEALEWLGGLSARSRAIELAL